MKHLVATLAVLAATLPPAGQAQEHRAGIPSPPHADSTEQPWTSRGIRNGITLAYRDDPAANAREVRATSDLPFAARRIFELVCDQTQYRSILPGLEEARLLAGTVPADYEIYFRYSPRFGVVAARDVSVRVKSEADAGSLGCRWLSLPDRVPLRQGAVRMRLLRGSWRIEPLDAARSRVIYQVTADPGGDIPGWLVRRGALSALPDVIERVRQRLQGEDDQLHGAPVAKTWPLHGGPAAAAGKRRGARSRDPVRARAANARTGSPGATGATGESPG